MAQFPDFFGDYSDIKVSTQAEAELANEKPLYQLTRLSGLFTISGSGALSSPLNLSGKLLELYMNVRSLEELESRILSIQASGQ